MGQGTERGEKNYEKSSDEEDLPFQVLHLSELFQRPNYNKVQAISVKNLITIGNPSAVLCVENLQVEFLTLLKS